MEDKRDSEKKAEKMIQITGLQMWKTRKSPFSSYVRS